MTTVCGIVVNPVSGKAAQVDFDPADDCAVKVYDLDGDEVALGALDRGQYKNASETLAPARLSGYPRVHTDPGVSAAYRQQRGWGTCLYAGAALAAHLIQDGVVARPGGLVGTKAGVSSETSTRSRAADRWWTLAAEQHGIAERENICGDTGETSGELTSERAGRRGNEAAAALVDSFVDGVSEVLEWTMTYRARGGGCMDVDVLPWRRVVGAGLVLAEGSGAPAGTNAFWAWSSGEVAEMGRASLPVLRALNVGHMARWDRDVARGAMDNLVRLALASGAAAEDVDGMVERFNAGADPGAPPYDPGSAPKPNRPRYAVRRFGGGRAACVRGLSCDPRRAPAPPRRPAGRAAWSLVERSMRAVLAQRAALGWGALRGAL